ncbi:UvrD-helicase domain-containing protein [Mariniflexile litorale]|uniref:DNA 3'-5' helicase n=1 Tax=Mariniflexile litorale TaxID=3045158 RepID=A0AAU7EK22_9FLAO|nr:UvrD-helicase domain-containing protein [Mariniflexile sp. KMM 9835]MDQ8213539.1 UvrD-helicase domain-containing protein [Mariniflexile sp. KMM 9835]
MQNLKSMPQNHPFTIYNASAGSGKTFTLVKEYLKILFKSNNPDQYKRILAITFTNKAVAEMKERIIEELKTFSSSEILEKPDGMFEVVCDELDMLPKEIHLKSKKLLDTILHNYAAFDISTIDGFTHRLIRTFAFDLKLPLNFEVELDQEALLNEAVDSLISKAGTDKLLTNVLVDFAIEKADGDKSWDVSFDFNKIAKLLVNENDIPFIATLKDKTLTDFVALKTQLKTEIKTTETAIVEAAQSVLTLIEESGLEFKDFTRSTLPNHFKKASELSLERLYDNKLEENIEAGTGIYTKSLNPSLASTIDAILPQIETYYKAIKQAVFHLKFLNAFYRNITPLSVLNAINNELKTLKADQNKMLISEFNTIISKEISNQPTPFIYERMGEKFKHYFIDEFQDTSRMQWQNLIPLLDNSLATDKGTTMLVGDAKQAIYRWRGGKAEQFIGLFHDDNPFHIEKELKNLPTNFRSFKEVVTFNNAFFNYLASQVFSNEAYKNLYENAHQNISKINDGYVELSFLDIEKEDDRDKIFTERVLKTIQDCQKNNFKLEDICVLVRKKKEGVAIANYLSQHHIPIVSSETLLINNAPEVAFINNLMGLLNQPKNNELKIAVLDFLATQFTIENKHDFFSYHLALTPSQLFKSFEAYNVFISNQDLLQLPLYDLAETIVRSFGLVKISNAYIQFYLDVVLDFSQKKGSDISGFLDYFYKKKESLSIVSPKGQNAVQIMTIHKSKGLEFPVVIFPYADLDIYRELEPKEWFPINKEVYNGFSHTLLNFNKDFEHFSEVGLEIFNNHKSEQELDNINLLYVALTRAVEQLYVISTKDISAKGEVNNKKYSGLFINYLEYLGVWNDSQATYTFGNAEKTSELKVSSKNTTFQTEFISTSKESHNIKVVTKSGMLWDTTQEEAIEKGNLIHNIMSKIKTKDDIDFVINDYTNTSIINIEQAQKLKTLVVQIVTHPKLETYFNSNNIIYNERDIITKDGVILRPDRVVLNIENEAVIIDYKTGIEDKKHMQQLQSYQDVLQEMRIVVKKRILVYLNNNNISVKEV